MQNTYGVVYSWDESNNLTRCLYLFCHTYLAQMRIWKFLEIFNFLEIFDLPKIIVPLCFGHPTFFWRQTFCRFFAHCTVVSMMELSKAHIYVHIVVHYFFNHRGF